jgi:hypothetical protein
MIINKNDLLQGYEDIKKIIDILLVKHDIKFIVCIDAPSKFKDVKQYFNNHGCFKVFSGGDHGYLGQEYNIKFRALHDYMHVMYNLSFKFNDEKQLSDITGLLFFDIAWNQLGLTTFQSWLILNIIQAEIRGQIEYYEDNNSYVPDQSSFIDKYLSVV